MKAPVLFLLLSVQSALGLHAVRPTRRPRSRTALAFKDAASASASPDGPSTAPQKSLLVVGAGVLGRRVAAQYHGAGLGPVTAETRSEANHEAIRAELPFLGQWNKKAPDPKGVVRTKEQGEYGRDIFMKFGPQNFDHVVFCAPPSGNDDYVQEVRAATKMWNRKGRFVFTSSSAVYQDELGLTTEASPLKDPASNPRAAKLLEAEKAANQCGGAVLRLAGLYTESRGAHSYFLKTGEIASDGEALVNQIHYEDAASLVVAILTEGAKGATYVGCDGNPMGRQAVADAAGAALGGSCTFTGPERKAEAESGDAKGRTPANGTGRVMNNDWTRAQVGWEPKWPSFQHFMDQIAVDGKAE